MKLKILFPFCLLVVFKYSVANTIFSVKDGDWEDSASWNINQALSHTLNGDTIIIAHHINFNHALVLSNCYLEIDTLASLCGHDSIYLYSSIAYQYGEAYADMVLIYSYSRWLCYYGYWVFIAGFWHEGVNWDFLTCCGCGGHAGGGFICSDPVHSWKDTSELDTGISPLLTPAFFIYPNPSLDHFIIESEIPDSNSHITAGIFDLVGRKMKTISIPNGKSSLTIFTNDWAAGMYLLRFQDRDIIIQTNKIFRVK